MTQAQANATLRRIQEELERLRALDGTFTQFGSRSHGYRLGPPLTEAELQSHERRLGVVLPAEYRQFLAEVGHGGAGPYYGLFALDSKDPEDPTAFGGDLTKPFKWTKRFNPEEWDREETGQPELSDFSPRRKAPPRQTRPTQANCRRLRSWPEQRNNRAVQADPFC